MAIVIESGWEVCRQLGGIYTVLRSKAPSMIREFGEDYCLLGPYNAESAQIEFEEKAIGGVFQAAAEAIEVLGIRAYSGRWLIPGRPQVVLLDIDSALARATELRFFLWQHHGIESPGEDSMLDEVLAFGDVSRVYLQALCAAAGEAPVTAHFHEWMGGAAIPELRRLKVPVGIVFTTHATMLGRYLATGGTDFYAALPQTDWAAEADRRGIGTRVRVERALAHGAHVFTTLGELTALECEHLLGRKPDLLLPNGIHIEHLPAAHEVQNLHQANKVRIERFVISHFFPTYTFDLDKTLYFFTSGRYEYQNKGFNLTLDALAELNRMMRRSGSDRTVVAFLITKRPHRNFHPDVLASMALMEELRETCESIKDQIGDRLFLQTALGNKPWLFELVDEYWWIRLRRARHSWRSTRSPYIITHIPKEENDDVLSHLRRIELLNGPDDPVKIVYHPDFITTTNPLFSMEYDQFVRGCHLGIFPSYYEPWGYTPLESLALGTPAITSDLAGFGNYALEHVSDPEANGLRVLPRRYASYEASTAELAMQLFRFTKLERRNRIELRNRTELISDLFDWSRLVKNYRGAIELASKRGQG